MPDTIYGGRMMRHLVIILAAISATAFIPTSVDAQYDSSRFCEGYSSGYSSGYKSAAGLTSEPVTPICPTQPMKSPSDPTDDFEHGLAVGRIHGMMEGMKP